MTTMQTNRFDGKVAMITGAAGGIGLAAVNRFASEGALIVALDLDGPPLAQVIQVAEAAGSRAVTVPTDVSQPADWQVATDVAQRMWGGVDILINCAGVSGPLARLEECPVEAFDRVMAINVRGIFLGMQAVTPSMRARGGGSIVNVSSISGERGNPRVLAYATSKHAVNGMSKCAALDLIEDGIRVNVVSPAPIDTTMMHFAEESAAQRLNMSIPQVRQVMTAGSPMGRYGQPEEIAGVMAFLCSDDASFMTGSIVGVDGGTLAK